MLLEYTEKLIDWFWENGVKREKEYAVSTSDWTKNLYDTRKELTLVQEAARKERPAFAIWGPSQTGKSTLVSAFIDEKATFVRKEGEDGKGSALHWEGGEPAFFMAPTVDEKAGETIPSWISVLNPFNGGLRDASACLSRFVYATLDRQPGAYHVVAPGYPVELHLVREKDLLHALARGYDTECLGPGPIGKATPWTLDRFQGELDELKARHPRGPLEPKREAYERLHDFCEVLDDLVFAELDRYAQLLAEGEANWKNVLASLLAEKVLIANPKLVEEFAAAILWDGYPTLTSYYQKLNTARQKYADMWRGKTIHCSIKVAALLLDMDACKVYFEPVPPNSREGDRPRVLHDAIPRLAYKEEGARVLLGFHPELPNRLNPSPEDFGILQGLVWEMVVPLNPAHLSDTPFLQFIKKADLLDFPGVGNERPEGATRIDLGPAKGQPEAAPTGTEEPTEVKRSGVPFTPAGFFLQILKRGKTASIVSTYAKRLTIDGFSIFQSLDTHPPVNAIQLQTGIHTWWKCMVPDYYHQQEGASPLPLNLALCWWAKMIDHYSPNNPSIFSNCSRILDHLGKLARPDICVTFALNYYNFVRGEVRHKDFRVGSEVYDRIRSEPLFQNHFRHPISTKSFEEMAADQATGGTNYFFAQLAAQVDQNRGNPRFNRPAILKQKEGDYAQRMVKLLTEHNLFPPAAVDDARVTYLEEFKNKLLEAVEAKSEKQMRAINQTLREYVSINYTVLQPVPRDPAEIHEKFIRSQYARWISAQAERYRTWRNPAAKSRKAEPDWSLLGCSSEIMFRRYLEALVASLDAKRELREIALWLRKLVQYRGEAPAQVRADLRPHLAIKMCNAVVYGKNGIESLQDALTELSMADDFDDDNPPPEPKGKQCPSYQVFMRPFIETELEWFLTRRVEGEAVPPPDLAGAVTLKDMFFHYMPGLVELCPSSAEEIRKLENKLTKPQNSGSMSFADG
jgi:hypothetical protein